MAMVNKIKHYFMDKHVWWNNSKENHLHKMQAIRLTIDNGKLLKYIYIRIALEIGFDDNTKEILTIDDTCSIK